MLPILYPKVCRDNEDCTIKVDWVNSSLMAIIEIIFLAVASLKGIYCLTVAALNFRKIWTKRLNLSDKSDTHIASAITYRLVLITLEVIASGLIVIPLVLGLQTMRNTILGFLIWFATGAIEDFSEFLIHRYEQRRRQPMD